MDIGGLLKSIIYILENRPFIVESVARKPMKQTNKNGVQQEAGFQEAHSEVKIGKISGFPHIMGMIFGKCSSY